MGVVLPCSHQYEDCAQPLYERCQLCGTFHSQASAAPETIYGAGYWDRPDHSSIRDQNYNVDVHREGGDTKNECVLRRIDGEDRSAALEIACAPGSLLRRLRNEAGFERVVGVEVDRAYEADIQAMSDGAAELLFGYFPAVTEDLPGGSFSLVVGLDIFEHAHEPARFVAECARLLKPGGQLILMLPLVGGGDCTLPERFFYSAEHVFLHSMLHMEMLLGWAGFEELRFSGWTAGHEVVSARLG